MRATQPTWERAIPHPLASEVQEWPAIQEERHMRGRHDSLNQVCFAFELCDLQSCEFSLQLPMHITAHRNICKSSCLE